MREWKEADEGERCALVERFLLRYLPALRMHLRHRFATVDPHEQEDLLQSFVADQIIQRAILSWADARKGRFRAFLKTCLNNFVFSSIRSRSRDHASSASSMYQDMGDSEPATDMFDVVWARQVLSDSIVRMKDECHRSGRQLMWDVFDLRVLRPMMTQIEPPSYADLSVRLGIREKQVANLLVTAKRMLARVTRDVVQTYSASKEEVDEEIQDLLRLARHAGLGGWKGFSDE